ncbi:MAG TPA: hypothetical protein DDX01_03645, partial [Holosporales bacterium]|nr:hypothetical protein [Holosporales bacterium]
HTKESGLWIRNKNFLVKSSDYLMYQGANRIIHEPLSNWIFAEISHKNMKEFLEVTRNQFVIKSDEFKQFRREIDAAISPLNGRLRKIYDYGIQRVKLITGPFEAVGSGEENDPFVRAQKKLFALVPGDNRQQIVQEIIGTLSLIRSDVLEAADTVVFKIEEKEESIVLEDSDNSYIFIDPTNNSSTQITYDAGTNRAIISIPRSMFNSKEITFVGDVYTVHYVDAKQSNDGISFNRDTRQIYVNIFSSDIINYSISFIDVMLAVEYAYRVSQNTLQMREYILLMLGGDYDKTHDIYSNLADNID